MKLDPRIAFLLGYLGIMAVAVGATSNANAVEYGSSGNYYDCGLLLGGWSHHTIERDGDDTWNETHRAFGVECNNWSFKRFDNSYDKEAYGLGYTWEFVRTNRFEIGTYTALWTGYEEIAGEPGVLPVASVRVDTKLTDSLSAVTFLNPVAPVLAIEWEF